MLPSTMSSCVEAEKTVDEDLLEGLQLYDKLQDGKITVYEVKSADVVFSISNRLDEKKD